MAKNWTRFPHASKSFQYSGAALQKAWKRLHAGDQEPYPSADFVSAALRATPALKKRAGENAEASAESLQDAWRAFHQGEFQHAAELGESLGPLGANVQNKATAIYATYLVEDQALKLKLFQECAERAEALAKLCPDWPNAHYQRAYALGRYSQGISITKALAQGLGGKVKEALTATLDLAPKHAEAHLAMALYHAEIIEKVGAMIGGLTYGAKTERALEHFETARKLTPDAPIVHLEYGNGLLMLYGKKRQEDARRAFETAAKLKPADAMERLDVEAAKARLE